MKRTVLLLIGNALAAFMDFGIGTAIATGVTTWCGIHLPWYLVFIGGVLALVPDFDLVPSVIHGVSPSFDHRQTCFHRPLLILPLIITTAYLFGGSMWALIAGLCVFTHYVHDTNFVGTNYGIAWLWPFSHRYWSIFGSFTPKRTVGSHHEWLQKNWLRPSLLSVREIGIGLGGICVALWLMDVLALMIFAVFLVTVASVNSLWIIERRFPL